MISKKRVILVMLLVITIIANLAINAFAYTEITEENLQKGFSEFVGLWIWEDYNIEVIDASHILMAYDGLDNIIEYNINEETNQIIFSCSLEFNTNMSYEEFLNKDVRIVDLLACYNAVAETQNVSWYIADEYEIFISRLNNYGKNTSTTITYEDLKEDLPKYLMQYLDENWKNGYKETDYAYANTYTLTVEKENETATSCTYKGIITVNLDSDFSSIEGILENMNKPSYVNDDTNDGNATDRRIPQTGTGYGIKEVVQIMLVVTGIILIGMIAHDIKRK